MAPQPWYKYPRSGWGEQLHKHLKTDKVAVINKARNGASAKTFFENGFFSKVLRRVKSGDIVIIGFGHNDKGDDSSAIVVFREYISNFIKKLKSKGAVIIIGTPINLYGLAPDHGEYPEVIKSLAGEYSTALADLTSYSVQLHQQMGLDAVKDLYLITMPGQFIMFPNGIQDFIHLSPFGAQLFAKHVADVINDMII